MKYDEMTSNCITYSPSHVTSLSLYLRTEGGSPVVHSEDAIAQKYPLARITLILIHSLYEMRRACTVAIRDTTPSRPLAPSVLAVPLAFVHVRAVRRSTATIGSAHNDKVVASSEWLTRLLSRIENDAIRTIDFATLPSG
ncbi:UNVERIFIED_CONTAM: hypothetical protein Slati_1387600 [Sesamum latifolium]|uniref:Uncharacterized protein n=1 Tax=Sesamum latifolium TaxID=2727402 RepID=A0AAW2X2P8_9LAMI